MRFAFLFLSILLSVTASGYAQQDPDAITAALASITSPNPVIGQQAITTLRRAGPAGLAALLDKYDRHPDRALLPAIDAVAGQCDAVWSRLYWYTDLAQAESAARSTGKPILYLRLMGKLTDEYSCANSRFFRTVLYANRSVSSLLRERFVLVWCSERPVPVVTIDYGDGRTLKRTLTGNSIHYVLDSDGHVFDALPGLFDPVTFAAVLTQAGAAVQQGETARGVYLARAQHAIFNQWRMDTAGYGPPLPAAELAPTAAPAFPDAAQAAMLAVSKTGIERPIIAAMSPEMAARFDHAIATVDEQTWQRIAARHADDSALDPHSIDLIRSQRSADSDPANLARMLEQFQKTIALDSVHNNYQLRAKILAWLQESPAQTSVENLNHRVYAELFLTPRADPWLGLRPADVYTALSDDDCSITEPR